MTSNFRWRWGETNPVLASVASESEIHIGDLLWMDTEGRACPASEIRNRDQGGVCLFQERFLGVAMQASPAGIGNNSIRVATGGTFHFDCGIPNAKQHLGMKLYPVWDEATQCLKTQTVGGLTEHHDEIMPEIGRISHTHNVESGSVYVAISSAILYK